MKDILFIEIYATTLRLCKYEKQHDSFIELDITGGYGKKAIPQYVHYIEDEINPLVGEDALLYDNVDRLFVDSMFKDKTSFIDYMTVLIAKLQAQHALSGIEDIVFINSEENYVGEPKEIHEFQGFNVSWVGIKECLIGYLDFVGQHTQENFFLVVFDEKMGYLCFENEENIIIEVLEVSMEELDNFYKESLKNAHQNLAHEYQILRLYEAQKSVLHQQLLSQKDVNVYSSIFYPPKKIVLNYENTNQFIIQWEKYCGAHLVQQLNKLTSKSMYIASTYTDHPLIKMVLGKKMKEAQRIDFLLTRGCIQCFFSETTQQKVKKVLHETPKFTATYFLKVNDQMHKIVEIGCAFTREISIELVLTGRENCIELFLEEHSINLKNITTTRIVQIIDYRILFDEMKNVCEVKYELR